MHLKRSWTLIVSFKNSFSLLLTEYIIIDAKSFQPWTGYGFSLNFFCISIYYIVRSDVNPFYIWFCTGHLRNRYLNNHLSSTLTVSWQQRPAHQLKAKLRAYMRPKCHPIFFDTGINSPETIRLNLYQAFVLCAMKFHCYVHQLSFWCKIHPTSCLSCIEGSLRYMYNN